MEQTRHLTTRTAAVALTITLAGCAAPDGFSAPVARPPVAPGPVPAKLVAGSPLNQRGVPGFRVLEPPVVSVLDQTGAPMKNVAVVFLVTAGEGFVVQPGEGFVWQNLVLTDSSGVAATDWRLGDTIGENTVTATVPTIEPLVFEANARNLENVIRWNLQLVNGQAIPVTLSPLQLITGGHYALGDDGLYTYSSEINGRTSPIVFGRYVRIDSVTVEFYEPPFPQAYLLSIGSIQGNVMSVRYNGELDWYPETYTLSPN